MATLSRRYRIFHLHLAQLLSKRRASLCRFACLAACLALPSSGFGQTSSAPPSATAGTQLPAETEARLGKLNADLKAAQANKEAAGQSRTLNTIGVVYFGLGERRKALDYFNQALALGRQAGDHAGESKVLNNIGQVYSSLGEKQKALDSYNQALPIERQLGDRTGEATMLNNIGSVYSDLGENQKALNYYSQALPIRHQLGDLAGEAVTLYNFGTAYAGLGDSWKALDYLTQALSLVHKAGDHAGESKVLNNTGGVYSSLGEKQKALDCFNQALAIERLLGDRVGEAKTLNNIGLVYNELGENQKALIYHDQALTIRHQVGDHAGEATSLNNIALVSSQLGEHQKALDYYIQSLLINRQLHNQAGEAATLHGLGTLYLHLGENGKAFDYLKQDLLIFRQVGDRVAEERTLTNIGVAYSNLGENQKALDYLNQSLQISRQAGDRAGEATTLVNVGTVYLSLGDGQKSLDYFNQALAIERLVTDRAGEAVTLSNIGSSYSHLGERQKALNYYTQALSISREVEAHADQATTLSNVGTLYAELGEHQRALDCYNQALLIHRQVGDRAGEGRTLTSIGSVYIDLAETKMAFNYYNQALPIAAFVNDPQLQAMILADLSHFEEVDRPVVAILYGKLAVNLLQQLRGNIRSLPNELQRTFLVSISDNYRYLSALLIKQGRLSEAQQVLNLLKDQEYREYVRGATSDALGPLSLTPAEQTAEQDYQKSTAKVVEQGKRWSELKQNKARTPDEDKEFQQLSDSLGNASQLMNEYFARLYKLFAPGGDANRQVANITDETASLKQQIAKMPHTVALYTVVSEDRYSVIVISGPTMVAREYVIKDKDLYEKVAAFRQIILDPTRDPKPLARELYKILIGPIKADLDQAKAETLIWSLDGVLRYVPFAALYDGEHYLVESYSLASFTPASIAHISDKPNLSAVSAAAMGISAKFDERLQPLPRVETELDSIVQDPQVKASTGVMPGTILLNGKFTELAMEQQLDGQRAVVHIASHFVMRPGDDSQSYLLMAGKGGDTAGYHMTVASFRDNQKMSLEGTELLTLSACDTGIGGSSANGREVDGLATTAQRKGAKSVISSLWRVDDNSTASILTDFYKRWVQAGGKVTKAEALRQAQLDLLLGRVTAKVDSSDIHAVTSYAQPYYWAPFALMGNWQ